MSQRIVPFVALLATTLAVGCVADEFPCGLDDGCDTDSGSSGSPPDVQASAASGELAIGGTAHVTVTSTSGAPLSYTVTPGLVVSVLRADPGRLDLEVTCTLAGSSALSYGTAAERGVLSFSCSAATRVVASLNGLSLPSEPDVFFVPAGAPDSARVVELTLVDEIGRALTDDSFAVTPTSEPAPLVRGPHELALPTSPGTIDLAVSSRSLAPTSLHLRVVDHIDALVGERSSGTATSGTVCFYGLTGDARVLGAGWEVTPSGVHGTFPADANCVRYTAASGEHPTAQVSFGGIEEMFALDEI